MRLMGIDTPELHDARCPAEHAAASRARQALEALLHEPVTVERRGTDRYGRTLAVVRQHGRDIALDLVARGLGRRYHGGMRGGWC